MKTMHQQEIVQLQDEMEQTRKDDMESSKKQRERSYTRERALKEALRTAQAARPSDEVEDVAEIGRLRKAMAAEIEKNRSLSAAQVEDAAEIGRLRKAMAVERADTQRMRTTLSEFFLDDKDSRVHGVSVGTKAATTPGLAVPTEVAVPAATYRNVPPDHPVAVTTGRNVKKTATSGRRFNKKKDCLFSSRKFGRAKGHKSFILLAKSQLMTYQATINKEEKKRIRRGVVETFTNGGGRFFEAAEEGATEVNLERATSLSARMFTNYLVRKKQEGSKTQDSSSKDETKQTEFRSAPLAYSVPPAAAAATRNEDDDSQEANCSDKESDSDYSCEMEKKPKAKKKARAKYSQVNPETHSAYDCPKCDMTFPFPKKYSPPLSSDGKVSDKVQWKRPLHQQQKMVRRHMKEKHKKAFPMEEWPEAYIYRMNKGGGKEYFKRMEERKRMAELELTAEKKKKQMIELPPSIVI